MASLRSVSRRPARLRFAHWRFASLRFASKRLALMKVRLEKVRRYVRMLLSPLIPGRNSLFQDCQMLFIRHRLSPAALRELPRHISREPVGTQEALEHFSY